MPTTSADQWQTREDVNDLMRPHMIRADKKRHGAALDMMRRTLDHEEKIAPRIKARAGRKTSTRKLSRGR